MTIFDKLNSLKAGRFFGITYKTEKTSNDGSTLEKITRAVVRTKISNDKRKDYTAPTSGKTRHEDVTYLIPKCVKQYNKTGNKVVMLFPRKGLTHSTYLQNGVEVSRETFENALKSKPSTTPFGGLMTVSLDNIIEIRSK